MSITEFFKKHKEKFNLSAFERAVDIRGQLLSQVARGIPYRSLNEDQKTKLKEHLKPIYESLKELFE